MPTDLEMTQWTDADWLAWIRQNTGEDVPVGTYDVMRVDSPAGLGTAPVVPEPDRSVYIPIVSSPPTWGRGWSSAVLAAPPSPATAVTQMAVTPPAVVSPPPVVGDPPYILDRVVPDVSDTTMLPSSCDVLERLVDVGAKVALGGMAIYIGGRLIGMLPWLVGELVVGALMREGIRVAIRPTGVARGDGGTPRVEIRR